MPQFVPTKFAFDVSFAIWNYFDVQLKLQVFVYPETIHMNFSLISIVFHFLGAFCSRPAPEVYRTQNTLTVHKFNLLHLNSIYTYYTHTDGKTDQHREVSQALTNLKTTCTHIFVEIISTFISIYIFVIIKCHTQTKLINYKMGKCVFGARCFSDDYI